LNESGLLSRACNAPNAHEAIRAPLAAAVRFFQGTLLSRAIGPRPADWVSARSAPSWRKDEEMESPRACCRTWARCLR